MAADFDVDVVVDVVGIFDRIVVVVAVAVGALADR